MLHAPISHRNITKIPLRIFHRFSPSPGFHDRVYLQHFRLHRTPGCRYRRCWYALIPSRVCDGTVSDGPSLFRYPAPRASTPPAVCSSRHLHSLPPLPWKFYYRHIKLMIFARNTNSLHVTDISSSLLYFVNCRSFSHYFRNIASCIWIRNFAMFCSKLGTFSKVHVYNMLKVLLNKHDKVILLCSQVFP